MAARELAQSDFIAESDYDGVLGQGLYTVNVKRNTLEKSINLQCGL